MPYPFNHPEIKIGACPIHYGYPYGQVFDRCKEEWENPNDPRFTTSPTLLTAVVKLIPELMLQKLERVETGTDEIGYQPFVSSVREMFLMMKTNDLLEEEALTSVLKQAS